MKKKRIAILERSLNKESCERVVIYQVGKPMPKRKNQCKEGVIFYIPDNGRGDAIS